MGIPGSNPAGERPWNRRGKKARIARILTGPEPSIRTADQGKPRLSDMSELATQTALRPSTAQLPVSWYFDPHIFQLEQERLFASGPKYVGHELMVPNQGDYQTLAGMD